MLIRYTSNNNITDCLIKTTTPSTNSFLHIDCEYRHITAKHKSDFLTASVKWHSTLNNHAIILARVGL